MKNSPYRQSRLEDIPSDILNILNDDCLQEIFRRLTNVRDFLSVAQVCTRFQENAQQCIPSQFKEISIRGGFFINSIPTRLLTCFLQIFGGSVKSIRWHTTERNSDTENMNILADHCGKSLLELTISDHNIDLDTRSDFEVLEKLEIETGLIKNFRIFPQLKVLKLKLVKVLTFDSIVQIIPKVEEIELVNINGFTDDMLIEFLTKNPQLRRFKVEGCKRVSSSILRDISIRVPHLVSLHIMFFNPFFENDDLLHIANLRQLKCLGIYCNRFSAKSLIELLVKNNVQLESLSINGYGNSLAEAILNLNLLKHLDVGNVSEEIFIRFVEILSSLEEIRVQCNDITPDGMETILKCGKHLTKLTIVSGCQMTVDLDIYNSILILAKDRVRVLLMIRTDEITLKKTLNYNRDWLNICYF
ncbi:uncharacterized protein LOC116350314 [Contarinia nasturtii]|uniref:uncharacterized protein LOC116350314 n=1 Tax=Contarinia nasturtii TaxID=265458 RepID=UPI0012D4AE6A|nr:uncharacterized protein LOC116350314 [Contarinia nasturtii]